MTTILGIEVPSGWNTTSFGELCARYAGELQTGPFGSQLHASDYVDEGVPVVMPQDLAGGTIVTDRIARVRPSDADRLGQHKLLEGDIIYSRRGDVTRFAIAKRENVGWLCGTGCLRIRAGKAPLSASYARWFLELPALKAWLLDEAKGATMPNLNTSILGRLPLLLPPLPEQKRIAAILDKADAIKRKRQEAIRLTEELLRAAFLEMFGDPVTNPKVWPVKKLGEVVDVATGGTPSRAVDGFYGGTIPWITTSEVTGGLITFTAEHLTSQGLAESNCKVFPKGTVVVAMYGQGATRGRCGLLGIDAATNQACAAAYPSRLLPAPYLLTMLRLRYEELRSLGRGGNQPNLNLSLVRGFDVSLPDEDSLARFDRFFTRHMNLLQRTQGATSEVDSLSQVLAQSAFSGKL